MTSSRALVEKLGFAEYAENIWWSYDQEEFALRTSPDQVYLEHPVFNCKNPPGNLRDESLRAAKIISERHRRPVILFSGGVDSEIALLSFHIQKIPVEVVILDYNGFNEHDIFRAKALCQKLGIGYRIKTFDVFHFWENDLQAVAEKIHCASPQVATICVATNDIDGYLIAGDGDSSLRGLDRRFFETKSETWALARWMLLNGREGCPRFFQYTKELEASWYFEPLVEQFVSGVWEFFDFKSIMYLKPFIAHKYFGCDLRPKLTGFENIHQSEDYRQKLMALLSPVYDLSWTYENARKWALQKTQSHKWVPLEQGGLASLELNALRHNGTKRHLIGTE